MFGKTGIKNQKYYRRKIIFLILLLICVFASFRYISIQVLELSERQCVNRLMENTDHFCTVLNQNIEDARDHLESLADVSGENINDKEKLQEMRQAFAVYGFLCRLEILFPDNTLMMSGVKEIVPTNLNFEEEAAKGSIISSRMKDPLDGKKDIFKITIPIKDENKTHGILYGIMDIELLTKALDLSFYEGKADYFVIEQYNGELVLDTRTDNLSDENEKFRVSEQEQLYEAVLGIKKDLRIGKESYAKLYAKKTGEYIFLGYGNVGIKDWRGMISVPENVAFSYADETMLALRGSMVLVFLSVLLFMAFSLRQELKEIKKNQFVMQMQSLLMQAQRTEQAFEQALLTVKDKFLGEIIFLTNFNESTEKLLVMGNTSIEEELQDSLWRETVHLPPVFV